MSCKRQEEDTTTKAETTEESNATPVYGAVAPTVTTKQQTHRRSYVQQPQVSTARYSLLFHAAAACSCKGSSGELSCTAETIHHNNKHQSHNTH
jgi:hypothetical protein